MTDPLNKDTQARLKSAASALRRMGWRTRLELLTRCARRWRRDADDANAATQDIDAIAAACGLSAPMVRWGIATTCEAFARDAEALLRANLTHPERLDGPFDGVMVCPPDLCAHVWASTLPTSGWIPVFSTLLCGSAALIKAPASATPAADALARSLADIDPRLGDAVVVASWRGGGPEDEALVERCDALVVSGGEAAVKRFALLNAERRPPARQLAFGPGRSLTIVPQGALPATEDLCLALALDVAAYDQLGCLSPQTLWIETDDPALGETFSRRLAAALDRIAVTLPRGDVPAAALASIMQRRGTAAFQGRVFEARDALVLWEPEPYRHDCPLYRTIAVHPFQGDPMALAARLRQTETRLHAVAVAGDAHTRLRWTRALATFGVSRVCAPGTLQTPPGHWHHDGHRWLSHLLHFVDVSS